MTYHGTQRESVFSYVFNALSCHKSHLNYRCVPGDAEGLLHHELRSFWACLYQQLVRLSKRLVVADFSQLDDGARGIVEMMFRTSLIALDGAADPPQSSPRRLQTINTKVSCSTAVFDSESNSPADTAQSVNP